jgi:tRNA U34 5-carboxymethylaminomethyl modifying enzyme MnmG/GidA
MEDCEQELNVLKIKLKGSYEYMNAQKQCYMYRSNEDKLSINEQNYNRKYLFQLSITVTGTRYILIRKFSN